MEQISHKKKSSLKNGIETIKNELLTIPNKPGIYQMIGPEEEILYIGKAKDLKTRVTFYTQPKRLNTRLTYMVSNTIRMEINITTSEMEALLLESNLIKKLEPTYNILLKDDKSFSSILISTEHLFPQLVAHRGLRNIKGKYFGPFVSRGTVYKTIETLQKAFLLRTCNDSMFNSRSRPCLQYQIKRCSAPCVNFISEKSYKSNLKSATDFLTGNSKQIKKSLVDQMYASSDQQNYEAAAIYRNRIKALTEATAHQNINIPHLKDLDILALKKVDNKVIIQMSIVRGGCNYGSKPYYPNIGKNGTDVTEPDIIQAFLCQFYDKNPAPPLILVNIFPKDKNLVEMLLTNSFNYKVKIESPHKGRKLDILELVLKNANENLNRKIYEKATNRNNLKILKETFNFSSKITKIELYDNSHHQGGSPIGAMVAFGEDGFLKSNYRRFNIEQNYINKYKGPINDIKDNLVFNNNDYAMMHEVIKRRFKNKNKSYYPNLLIIDGGKGHLNIVLNALKELNINDIDVMAISKGRERDAGRDNFHTKNKSNFNFIKDEPILFFLQNLRDEVHRYAIAGHRLKSKKNMFKNPLDEIIGIGAKRKKALLDEIGSAKSVAKSTILDLSQVSGISVSIAKRIFNHFQNN